MPTPFSAALPFRMAYATVEQLGRLLNVSPTDREADLSRVLEAAALEIDSEIGGFLGWSDDEQALALVESVNLERAQDLWELEQVPAGILGLGGEVPMIVPRNSWERHAQRLAPLKTDWGLA